MPLLMLIIFFFFFFFFFFHAYFSISFQLLKAAFIYFTLPLFHFAFAYMLLFFIDVRLQIRNAPFTNALFALLDYFILSAQLKRRCLMVYCLRRRDERLRRQPPRCRAYLPDIFMMPSLLFEPALFLHTTCPPVEPCLPPTHSLFHGPTPPS